MDGDKMVNKIQIVFFSHGGGPLPILGDESHASMVEFMRCLPSKIKRPESIIVISAHWEEQQITVTGSGSPSLFYDYYGFPDEAYQIDYPAPGNQFLANEIADLFKQHQITVKIDHERGFDHGLFIPLKLMYPDADIPSIQISLLSSLSAKEHIATGKVLKELSNKNVLIIGSGFSFHNMNLFSWNSSNKPDPHNDLFQDWLIDTCTTPIPFDECKHRLINWEEAPSARYCHPREEHLLPLHVCAAIAEKPADLVFDDYILGKRSIALLWQ
jgi:aromatic ring-opening dioxygenase catalytic subunit (LigB family)